ncbi:hypothetical protein HDU91_003909, partial [Kappamyces sp. JEL0680]
MTNKVYLVTGGNSGIGLGCAMALAQDPTNTVVIAARTLGKNQAAIQAITAKTGNTNVFSIQLELSDLESVHSAAQQFTSTYARLDGLVCNAGILAPPTFETGAQGHEKVFSTNHLGHFLLIQKLWDIMEATGSESVPSRLAIVSSFTVNPKNFSVYKYPSITTTMAPALEQKGYHKDLAYTNSKLLNAITGYQLAKRSRLVRVVVYDPGYVPTDITRNQNMVERCLVTKVFPYVTALFWSKVSTVERSGGFLAALATGEKGENAQYYSVDFSEAFAAK